MPYTYAYPMAPVTSTGVVFLQDAGKTWVLLGKRSSKADAFPNRWCIPGGFVDVGKETAKTAVLRELREETGLELHAGQVRVFMMDDTPGDDPRYDQLFNTCWIARLQGTPADYPLVAGDDILEVRWVPAWDPMTRGLAFGHNGVMEKALEELDS